MPKSFISPRAAKEDLVFLALADSTRRAVVDRLARGPMQTTILAAGFDMALPSFTQHLGILEKSGLVRSEKKGRVRTYYLETKQLRKAEDWLAKRRAMWERRLDQLDSYLLKLKENNK
jgi:DNA-binding transcriptional ArsR family regulator